MGGTRRYKWADKPIALVQWRVKLYHSLIRRSFIQETRRWENLLALVGRTRFTI